MTQIPNGITRITFDSNGVPRIRDTGLPVWHIVSRLYEDCPPEGLIQQYPNLCPDDIFEASHYRGQELVEFMRHLGHDALSQVNSIFGFAELVNSGVVEPHEEHDLITGVFRGNSQFLLNLFVGTGRVLNCIMDRDSDFNQYRSPMSIGEFVKELAKGASRNSGLDVQIDGIPLNETEAAALPMLMSEEVLQIALCELIRLTWFARRFDNTCALTITLEGDHVNLTCRRRLLQPGALSFLTNWSLSPVPVATYVVEQRGGALTVSAEDDQTVVFAIRLPLITVQAE